MDFYPQAGVILTPERIEKTEEFLNKMGLRYEGGADYTVQLVSEYGEILGNGCLCGNVLKYIAVDDRLQGEGAALTLVSELVAESYRRGVTKLFLFTKASNEMLFRGVGFYTLAATNEVCFMENTRTGLTRWLASIEKREGVTGAIVMNCNPFTRGHRYLIETASKEVDDLIIFVVSEDRSRFPFEARYNMVLRGTADLPNVRVLPSGEYMISSATFPTYFIKDTAKVESIYAALDLTLFAQKIAPALNITKRFVGTEPYCSVTRNYNEIMKELLPQYGVEVIEVERFGGISASSVREALDKGDAAAVDELVPASTAEYLRGEETI
ncbi:MAG: [Clostridia bacterium]|nr:[citrate (pro-3S)-lyase] ligase [Clostridia bacterium]